jgi:hypothetical protein
LWSENNFWGFGGATGEGDWKTAGSYPNNTADQAPFETSVTDSLTAMIRVHRNHPSIIIAILEGKAAIEFRSYYAGTTVIKATSPGLTAGTITITSQGTPAWVEGVTPPTAARPYTRYNGP